MVNLEAAAEAVQQIAEKFRGIIDLADALKGMANIESTIKEREAAKAAAGVELDALNQKVADASTKLTAAETAHRDRAATAQAASAGMISDAEKKAADIVAAAEKKAADISEREATRAAASAEENRVAMQAAAERLASAQREAADVEAKTAVAQAEFDKISKKLGELRQTARQIAA